MRELGPETLKRMAERDAETLYWSRNKGKDMIENEDLYWKAYCAWIDYLETRDQQKPDLTEKQFLDQFYKETT